jgi:L-malate glycosyltransferase
MKNVLIVQKSLVQYRKDFFDQLRLSLFEDGVELFLVYGKENEKNGLKNDEVDLEWSTYIPTKAVNIGKGNLIWQPCLKELKGKDLVIVESANKLILNYFLMISRLFSKPKLGFWGHGRNMQDAPESLANKFKYLFIKNCDWWFAYTLGVKEFLVEKGYPTERITAVQNAIDTTAIIEQYAQVSDLETAQLKDQLGIKGNHVGIYCGGIYPEKQIDFLLECCQRIKAQLPDFQMLFIGSGIDAYKIIEASTSYPWIHYIGPKFGKDRVIYFKIASLFLMPGLVGLAILDSFAFETPIVTTNYEFHSPEIEYLEQGKNGLMVGNSVDEYSNAIIDLLTTEKFKQMFDGCKTSAKKYSMERMVENFKSGILQALK